MTSPADDAQASHLSEAAQFDVAIGYQCTDGTVLSNQLSMQTSCQLVSERHGDILPPPMHSRPYIARTRDDVMLRLQRREAWLVIEVRKHKQSRREGVNLTGKASERHERRLDVPPGAAPPI
jgi:hypothetical protein